MAKRQLTQGECELLSLIYKVQVTEGTVRTLKTKTEYELKFKPVGTMKRIDVWFMPVKEQDDG